MTNSAGGGGRFDVTRGLDRNPDMLRNVDLRTMTIRKKPKVIVTDGDEHVDSEAAARFAEKMRTLRTATPKKRRGLRRFLSWRRRHVS